MMSNGVVVHGFEVYVAAEDRAKVQRSKRTMEDIDRIGGWIIANTAETVAAEHLDLYGRYYPPPKRVKTGGGDPPSAVRGGRPCR